MSTNKDSIRKALMQVVLSLFEHHPKQALGYTQVFEKLNIQDPDSKEVILDIVKEATQQNQLREVAPEQFQIVSPKMQVEGIVHMTNDGSAFILIEGAREQKIVVAPRKLHTALHGDRVKVYVYSKGKGKRQEGEVIEIVKRAKMEFVGTVQLLERFAFFIPDDRKMLHDIFIPLEAINGAQNGVKALAEIINWPPEAKNPVGRIKCVLGKRGENETEMKAILCEYGFSLSFTPKALQETATVPGLIPQEEIDKRRDFREVPTFTIDPEDAKDFDDALSFRQLSNGHYEVGVHIADVSHYVLPDSALDKEACKRGTSVYLVDRVIPMLPEQLSNDLCSLKPHEDRLCFSVIFELDRNAHIIDEWFGKTIIHSRQRFTYEEAQTIIENKTGPFAQELHILNKLAYSLRERKFQNGAINFETIEVKFQLDNAKKPIGVFLKERKDAHKLVEDYMLLANYSVATLIGKRRKSKRKYTFVYRTHDAPTKETIVNFANFAHKFGYKISTKSDKELARSLNQLMITIAGKKEQNVLTNLAIRAMAKAIYTTRKTSHYGLAFSHYTHFTSPIRRYPDLMVHRLLHSYLSEQPSENATTYEQLCQHASEMERKAVDAERASIKYKQAEYLSAYLGNSFNGIVSGLTEWGMYVEIEENKCEGMIRLRDITDDFYVLDEKNYAIVGQDSKKTYQLGDTVRIKVKNVDLAKKQIDFLLVQD